MKPTHILNNEKSNNEPAIYFRPTFDITGSMLQYCICHYLDWEPEARINKDTVAVEMHRQLREYGYSRLIEDEQNYVDIDVMHTAEHYAHVLFPEFFNMTQAEAIDKYGPMPEYHLKGTKGAKAHAPSLMEEPASGALETLSAEVLAQPYVESEHTNGSEPAADKRRGRPRKNP